MTLPEDDQAATSEAKPVSTSSGPQSVEGEELLRVAAPKGSLDLNSRAVSAAGSWVTDSYYASGAADAVNGYHTATGKPAWTVPLDGNICEASRDITSTGKVAVVWAADKKVRSRCTQFGVIDVNKGAVLWRTSIPAGKSGLGLDLNVGISEDIAAVGGPDGTLGYRTGTGRQIWDAPLEGCLAEEHTGGGELFTMLSCPGEFRVAKRSPQTGLATWQYTLPKGYRGAWIVSGDPLVLAVMTKEDLLDADRLLTVSGTGKPLGTIDLGEDYTAGCADNDGTCDATVATDDTVYIASDPPGLSAPNHIAAFDIRTAKRKWTSAAPETPNAGTFIPVRADGDGLIAYMPPENKLGSRVVRLAQADGKQTILLRMPDRLLAGAERDMISTEVPDPALFKDGRLYLHRSGAFNEYTAGTPMTLILGTR
ncbi:outer membrane protein assembly factor BamB family protein [Streptomyces sp. WMMC940]|uniref:outer membrane protein assembly factor BamB family protein n=1 Tax=Streptomyces sp. WMMC940 TaxID=3015153 RepID=UPI0022B73D87|nr:PQQ-binding-like beta-propeller repeat protein [Streptomyces sp. WMMC940]MCZ7456961.1 PQQ-binding-like beta-propeller repeat protein [Streptomyces sp. WMMC940]